MITSLKCHRNLCRILIILVLVFGFGFRILDLEMDYAYADSDSGLWKLTAYCACELCCGKSDGIMASGKKVYVGAVACNWLPFGTKVEIDGKIYTVEDRGAKSLFGDKNNHIKHLDIYFPTHQSASRFGVQYKNVKIH